MKRIGSTPFFSANAAMSSGVRSRARSLWIAENTLRCSVGARPSALQRVEEALLGGERHLLEPDRHPAQHHVGRQLLRPGLERRLEGVAVRALVPEELDHLDLAGGGHRRRLLQADVVRALGRPAAPGARRRQGRGRPAPKPAAARPREKSRRVERLMARELTSAPGPAPSRRRRRRASPSRASASSFLLERADADAVDGAPALLALGQPALDAEHRQPGALLLGVLGAGEGTGLDEVAERVAGAAATACDARRRRCALAGRGGAGALAPATGRVGRAALAPGRAGSTPGGRGVAVGGSTPGRGRPAPRPRTGAGFLPGQGAVRIPVAVALGLGRFLAGRPRPAPC